MSKNFENEFRKSINALHFSSNDKKRLYKKIMQHEQEIAERKDIFMKKSTFAKTAAVAAICLMTTSGVVFAASKIASYVGVSNSGYDYVSQTEISSAKPQAPDSQSEMPDFPESFANGYSFDGGNTVYTKGLDDSGNTVNKWDDLTACYKNADGREVTISMSYRQADEGNRKATETRVIDGITVIYNYDEYLFLPDEDTPLDAATKDRLDNDDHFFVSYGSSEKETVFYSSMSFEKDGVSYSLYSNDGLMSGELYAMAEELIKE